jgi:outer membrane protein OmpA-like peptidoglycan-associated protein
MSHISFRLSKALLISSFFFFTHLVAAQKAGLEVTRCSAVDRTLTLKNVAVDATGRRWAANSKGIFQIKANDLAVPLTVAPGERNVLSLPGGNADFAWSEAKFNELVKTPCSVTAAWYDSKNQVLWLGTDEAGLFQFTTQPELKMVQQYLPVNSKLKSPHITHLFQEASGRLWVGNEEGIMYGTPGRWKSDLNGFSVQRVREYNTVIYVLADGAISKAPGGEKWSDLALQEKYLEGDVNDFDIDATGKMWILSGNVTRFDLIANTYDEFSGPEYYTSQYGTKIAVDMDGAVWIGTEDKGLFSIDKASNMVLNAFVEKPISCEGNGKDATLLAKITGGTEPYVYTWSGGLSGENPKNIGAGTYSLTVTDSKGVTRTAEVGVPDSRLKVKVKQKKPASGPGNADGSAEVDIATNASGITVLWDNGEALVVASKLTSGEHKVTVTDPKGCVMTLSVTIAEQGQPLTLALSVDGLVKCAGEKTNLIAKAQGGSPSYKYTWNNAGLTGDKVSVTAGNYALTVTDSKGATMTASLNLTQPEPISINVLVQSPPSAGGADGKALAQAKGGTGVYTINWDNGESTFTATKLNEGKHVVSATDANGCSTSAPFELKSKVDAFSVILREARPIKCAGEKTNLTIANVGGKTPYKEYQWSPSIKSLADGVTAGEYSVTATDALGTTATANISIKEPQVLTASAIAQSATSPGVEDGKALVSIKGGTGAMFFKWDNGETTAATNHLSAGLHYVTVTDENGCIATTSVTIVEGIMPLSMTIAELTKIKCAGEKASLEVQNSGGKGPFEYAWSNPTIISGRPKVAAGDYIVTVTDKTGTTATAAISVKQPNPITITFEGISAASTGNSDGQATAKAIGGSGNYSYKWSTGETTANAVRLGPGSQTVTVTDANGCTAAAATLMSENILPLKASISAEAKIKCAGEKLSLRVEVSGGKKPYKYAWDNPSVSSEKPANVAAGDYLLTVTDDSGLSATAAISIKQPAPLSIAVALQAPASTGNSDGKALATPTGGTGPFIYQWSSGESTNNAVKLAPGKQAVTATDANGCSVVGTVDVSENILALTLVLTEKTAIKCAGEKAALALKVSGGKGSFTYAWSNPALNGDAPNSVDGGDYTVTVTDSKGASKTASISIKQPAPLSLAVTMQAPAATGKSDGKALATPTGGTGPYTYQWSNGENTNSAVKLAPGKQTVTTTDANGCSAVGSVDISENILALTVTLTEKTAIKCAGEKAALALKVSGGKEPFTYSWNNAALSSDSPSGLDEGEYSVTVTDSKGSSKTASINVKAPTALSAELIRNIGATERNNDGKAELKVKGGTPKYTIVWDTKQTGLSAPKLPLGPHSVTVTDANGCVQKIDFETEKRILPELTGALESGQTIRMRLLNFDPDSSALKPDALPMLDELYDFMIEHPSVSIEIAGHTNNQPSDAFADQLSTARAKVVADYLFAKGVDPKRVVYKGYGKRLPLVPNTSPEGRRTNQRVEIKILSVKG